jgi:uncharacterized protein
VRVVIDTNVLVSGLMKQWTPPAEVVADLLAGVLVPLYDHRILDEYRDVLARPKFKLAADRVSAVLEFMATDGIEVSEATCDLRLPDPDDQPFADVAFTGQADLLITGNSRHFPVGLAIRVVTPREWLDIKKRMAELHDAGENERDALEPKKK